MKTIALICNEQKDPHGLITAQIRASLAEAGIATVAVTEGRFVGDADAILVVGGDGSVLGAMHFAVGYDLPLFGINLGRVGYLAEIEQDEIPQLPQLLEHAGTEERMLLSAYVTHGAEQSGPYLALNDVVVTHQTHFGLADLSLSDSCGNTVDYRCDGLILATPSGSTAYSLSAGGPALDGRMSAICATPICPYSFFNRSLLFPADELLTVTNTAAGGAQLHVSADGNDSAVLLPGDRLTVSVAEKKLKMLSFGRTALLSTLKRKMKTAHIKGDMT